jgi:GAF domain-containing protein
MRWIWDRLTGAFDSWVEGLIVAGAAAISLLAWRLLRDHLDAHLSLPTWLVALVVGFAVAILIIQSLRLRARRGDVEGIRGIAVGEAGARQKTAAYAEHVIEILYALRRVVAGTIPGVTVRDMIEDGILDPARDLLKSWQRDDVRLSVLAPEGDSFVMPFASGHNLESKRSFRLPIDDSFSKWAFRNKTIYWSSDLDVDERFVRHPRAAQEREYASIISVPIQARENVVAVFNAIFTPPDAFDEADLIYVRLIGSVIELVWELAEGPTPVEGVPHPRDGRELA